MTRVRISNDSLNCYGTRILTEGMDIEQYKRNPVLLFMHKRGTIVGYMKDIRVENGEVTGEPVFDEVTDLSKQLKAQFEFGSLRMVSASVDIIELSEAKEHLVPGQTRPTITRSRLTEVSMVDIGGNDDAIVLSMNGERINLGKDGECPLPLLNPNNNKEREMELKDLAIMLGLPEDADEATVRDKAKEMKQDHDKIVNLQNENEGLKLGAITASVEKAITERRISADKKEQFIELGKKIGKEELDKTFEAMSPSVKLSSIIGHQGGPAQATQEWKKLSDVPEDRILELRKNDRELYKKLYKAEYGIECVIED